MLTDIHYYFAPDVSGTDAATQALKLRMTRSLWDPSYIDESYIGTSVPAQWSQPNPNAVWLIPRMRQLIAQHFRSPRHEALHLRVELDGGHGCHGRAWGGRPARRLWPRGRG